MPSTIFTSESSYELDRLCVRRGIKFSDLIENAGKSASKKIEKKIIPSIKKFNKKIFINFHLYVDKEFSTEENEKIA